MNYKKKLEKFFKANLNENEYSNLNLEEILKNKKNLDPVIEGIRIIKESFPSYRDKHLWEFNLVCHWSDEKNKEMACQAVKWIIEEKLKILPQKAPEILKLKHFEEHNLGKMFYYVFKRSIRNALFSTYPYIFLKKDFFYRGNCKGKWKNKSKKFFAKLVRDLFENKLKIPIQEIPKKVSAQIFYKNGLSSLLLNHFKGSTYTAIQSAYPNRFKPWEFKKMNRPKGIWVGKQGYKNANESTKWLIEKKLKIPIEKIPEKMDLNAFKEYDLDSMVHALFKGKYYMAILHAYPQFSIEDFGIKNRRLKKLKPYLNVEEANEIIKDLESTIVGTAIKHSRFGVDHDETAQIIRINVWKAIQRYSINKKNFEKYEDLIMKTIHSSAKGAYRETMSDRILNSSVRFESDWEIEERRRLEERISKDNTIPLGFQDIDLATPTEKRKQFYRILKKNLTKEEYGSLKITIDNRIRELDISETTNRFSYKILDEIIFFLKQFIPRYKDIEKWDLKFEKKWEGGMGLELAKKATRHMFEKKLKIPLEEIPKKADIYLFYKNGLAGMLQLLFDGHPYEAIAAAYPGKFKPWEFNGVGAQIWKSKKYRKKYIAAAMKWYVEEKLKIDPKNALKEVYLERIKHTKILSMLGQCFSRKMNNDSIMKAIMIAYPDLFPREDVMKIKDYVKEKLQKQDVRKYKDWEIIKRIQADNLGMGREYEGKRIIDEILEKK